HEFECATEECCPLSGQKITGRDEIIIESIDKIVMNVFKTVDGKEVKAVEIVSIRKKQPERAARTGETPRSRRLFSWPPRTNSRRAAKAAGDAHERHFSVRASAANDLGPKREIFLSFIDFTGRRMPDRHWSTKHMATALGTLPIANSQQVK